MYARIDEAFQKALSGITLGREEILELLRIGTFSDECVYLRRKAYEASLLLTGGKAYLWGAIGLDYAYCAADCHFCSFGRSWGLIETEKIYTLPEILARVREYVDQQVHYIVMRTTQYYGLEQLMEYAQVIRREVAGTYEIIVNVGEFDTETANRMHAHGVDGVYHAIRLREGTDTHFRIEDRLDTLSAVKESPLQLIHLVEPVGIEHTYEEIADRFLGCIEYGACISGIMARIPVKGTPLGDMPQLSDEDIAKMTAVFRLAGGQTMKHICVHPASELAIQSGANVVVIETGAIPRDRELASGEWKHFDPEIARDLFTRNGFTVTP